MEKVLAGMPFPEAVKQEHIDQNAEDIEILVLGSSQIQRAINPEYLSRPTSNLANSSQLLFEDFQLLKHFRPSLPNLKGTVIEVSYDKLERNKSFTNPALHHRNLKFYDVNTFGRPVNFKDFFLFHANPEHFYKNLVAYLRGDSAIKLNRYGFDENKYDGIFKNVQYKDSIEEQLITIENVKDSLTYEENKTLLHQMIRYALEEDLEVLIYHPPTHHAYNRLRDPELIEKWQNLLTELEKEYPQLHFLIDDKNPDFKTTHFYNGNHLNPDGAEKASKIMDSVINKNFYDQTDDLLN